MPTWPSPRSERLGTPKIPAIRFTRGTYFGASRFTYATACQVARPPLTDRTRSPRPQRAFTSRLPAVWSPSLPLDITTTWTGLLLLAGPAPAGMAASLAAPSPSVHKRQPSDHDPLDLIEANLVAPAIIKPRRTRRRMVRHRGGLFEGAAVLEIGGDPGRPEAVIAELGCDPGRRGAPADHRVGVRLRQHRAGELASAAPDRPDSGPLGSPRKPARSRWAVRYSSRFW